MNDKEQIGINEEEKKKRDVLKELFSVIKRIENNPEEILGNFMYLRETKDILIDFRITKRELKEERECNENSMPS